MIDDLPEAIEIAHIARQDADAERARLQSDEGIVDEAPLVSDRRQEDCSIEKVYQL